MKKVIFSFFLIAVIICAAYFGLSGGNENVIGTCSVIIHCETVFDNGGEPDSFPDNGVILDSDADINEGDTAYDVLDSALKNNKLHAEFADSAYGKYVKAVANLYEGDFGGGSGWLFKVNGEFPDKGCSAYKVADGDIIELVYTCDMGNDVE